MRSVVIAGGGTAGHVEPALSLADELRSRLPELRVTALGTARGLERTLVPERGYDLALIPPVPLPRRPGAEMFTLPARIRAAVGETRRILSEVAAEVVVGFGGYVSVPAYLAARRSGIPIVVHEANARAGWANRLGARMTHHVAENYAGSLSRAVRLGCPLRPAIATLDRAASRAEALDHFGLSPERNTLLVFGGSQGARSINEAVTGLVSLPEREYQILHAVGERNIGSMPAGPHYHPVAYISRMDLAYAAADVAVCRAGAMTCAELASVGLPAIYVPYAVGNGEQKLNAAPVVAAGGGEMIEDVGLTAASLQRVLEPLLLDPARREAMGTRAAEYGIRDAAGQLADMVTSAAEGRR